MIEKIEFRKVPGQYTSTYEMLRKAYPDEIPEIEYFAILSLLRRNNLSFRAIADLIQLLDFADWGVAYNDAMIADQDMGDQPSLLECEIEAKLGRYGYREWLKEDN